MIDRAAIPPAPDAHAATAQLLATMVALADRVFPSVAVEPEWRAAIASARVQLAGGGNG